MSSIIIDEMRALANGPWNAQQKAWFEQRLKDAYEVKCVRMRKVFDPKQLELLFRFIKYRPERKQCYKNASDLVSCSGFAGMLPEMHYVEGIVFDHKCPLAIEHAWVRVGDIYIDPTFERCLHRDVADCEYVALIEKSWKDLNAIQRESGFYGDIYRFEYIKRLQATETANTGK